MVKIVRSKQCKLGLFLLLTIAMLVWSPNFIRVAGASTDSSVNAPVDIAALVPDIQGYTEVGTDNYNDWIAYQASLGVKNADTYLNISEKCSWDNLGHKIGCIPTNPPLEDFLVAQYNTSDERPMMVEIYEYADATGAKTMYDGETPSTGVGPIFQRWNAKSVLLRRGQFMVFIFYVTDMNPPSTGYIGQLGTY